jgi:hypothetical protein
MIRRLPRFLGSIAVATLLSQSVHAAFVVECYQPTGRGSANFSSATITNGRSTTISAAPGCQAGYSIFGGSSPYVFKYTPGVDADNYAPSAGLFLGNTWTNWGSTNVYASGAAGGGTGKYRVYATWPSSANISAAGISITTVGATNSVTYAPVDQNSTAISVVPAVNKWWLMAEIYLNANTTYWVTSTALSPAGFVSQRFQGVMWEYVPPTVNPCLSTPIVNPMTNGPFASGQTSVSVGGVSPSATAVTVYQGDGTTMLPIGSNTAPAGAATVTVTVSPLVKGKIVSATQTIAGQEGCVQNIGSIVGGGASPRIRIFASIRQPGTNMPPIGSNGGGSSTTLYWIKATGTTSGAPVGGAVVQPSGCWQTVVFYPTDSKYLYNGTFTLPDPNQYGTLEGFAFAIDDLTDTGPFQIYLDNIRNGSTMIQDFEGQSSGSYVMFYQPSFSGSSSVNLLNTPNAATISTANAAAGTNSDLITWQFNGLGASKWLRLNSSNLGGGATATPNPVVDLTQPIAVDVLVLPVGQSTGHTLGLISLLNDQTNCAGDNVTLSVSATPGVGTGPYAFQWQYNGANITGATTTTLSLNSVPAPASGQYALVIGDGSACTVTRSMNLTVLPTIVIDAQPSSQGPVAGDGTGYAQFCVSASVPDTCPCVNAAPLTYQWKFNGTSIPGATDSCYTINNVYMTNGGSYTLLVSNTCNAATLLSAVAKLYVYDPAVSPISPSCSGFPGLLGLYWTNQTSANAFTGSSTWTNIDYGISFDWGAGGPFQSPYDTATNYFTIRWLGQVQPYYPNQTYTFYTTSDDGVRLWVNGQLLIDKWVPQGAVEWSGSIALGTTPVDLILEYFEQTGNASVSLSWDSLSVPKATIPSSQMCAADPGTGVPPLASLTAPANNATTNLGSVVTLTAGVNPEEAIINKVEFYNNATNLLTTDNSAPYTQSWTPPAAGVYNLSARVYYNTSHTLNTPVNKLTVNSQALGATTISNIVNTTLTYGGGAGTRFVLLKSTSITAALSGWNRAATNATTPGSFTIPTVGTGSPVFYRIKSE